MVAVVRCGRGMHCPSASSWLCHWRCILTETKITVVLMIADICITICWWTTKSKSANISPVVGYSRTGKVHLFTCLPTNECDLHVSWFVRDIVSVCMPGWVSKMETDTAILRKTEPKPKARFWQGSKSVLKPHWADWRCRAQSEWCIFKTVPNRLVKRQSVWHGWAQWSTWESALSASFRSR